LRNQFCLVETALFQLPRMKRNWDYDYISALDGRLQFENDLG
jgi:hypothetical protein